MNIQKAQQGFGLVKVLISIPLVLIGLVILAFAYTELNKDYWDYRVKELCEKEGGVTVFETVELTKEGYEMYGGINGVISVPGEGSSVANRFRYLARRSDEVIRSSNPRVRRFESIVF